MHPNMGTTIKGSQILPTSPLLAPLRVNTKKTIQNDGIVKKSFLDVYFFFRYCIVTIIKETEVGIPKKIKKSYGLNIRER